MALLEGGPDEAALSERPAVRPIMGIGEIVMAHELPDGRFNLVVRGRARVQLQRELITDEPYRVIVAKVRPDRPVVNQAELYDADQSLRALVGRLAGSIPDGGELLRQVVASQATPEELVDVLAAALVADGQKRQRLLENRDLLKRIERITGEVVAMTSRIGTSGPTN
jgi:Lon protease-like protein